MVLAALILAKLAIGASLFVILYYYPMKECLEVRRGEPSWSAPRGDTPEEPPSRPSSPPGEKRAE